MSKLKEGFNVFRCQKCNCELVFGRYTHYGYELKCPNCQPYINHCWNCHSSVDSRVNTKSKIKGMGYICGTCGEDLQGWKIKRGLINHLELSMLRREANANAILR
jgi:hypothetical protein